jgi:hypothetical protein
MALRFVNLWRWDGVVSRKTYALVGLAGFAIKSLIDRAIGAYVLGYPQGVFLSYWRPRRATAILERTWDKAEDYGDDTALSKKNDALFEEIDKAMDQFISLFLDHPTSAPEAAKLKTAYGQYLEKLKLAD